MPSQGFQATSDCPRSIGRNNRWGLLGSPKRTKDLFCCNTSCPIMATGPEYFPKGKMDSSESNWSSPMATRMSCECGKATPKHGSTITNQSDRWHYSEASRPSTVKLGDPPKNVRPSNTIGKLGRNTKSKPNPLPSPG